MDYTQELAALAAQLQYADLPVAVVEKEGDRTARVGSATGAMSAGDVVEKARRLATVVLGHERCEQLVASVRKLDDLRDVSTLVPLLTAAAER